MKSTYAFDRLKMALVVACAGGSLLGLTASPAHAGNVEGITNCVYFYNKQVAEESGSKSVTASCKVSAYQDMSDEAYDVTFEAQEYSDTTIGQRHSKHKLKHLATPFKEVAGHPGWFCATTGTFVSEVDATVPGGDKLCFNINDIQ